MGFAITSWALYCYPFSFMDYSPSESSDSSSEEPGPEGFGTGRENDRFGRTLFSSMEKASAFRKRSLQEADRERFGPPAVKDIGPANAGTASPLFLKQLTDGCRCFQQAFYPPSGKPSCGSPIVQPFLLRVRPILSLSLFMDLIR